MTQPSSSDLRAVAAYDAVKRLLDLLQEKGVVTREEAFRVLEGAADDAHSGALALQGEPEDA